MSLSEWGTERADRGRFERSCNVCHKSMAPNSSYVAFNNNCGHAIDHGVYICPSCVAKAYRMLEEVLDELE